MGANIEIPGERVAAESLVISKARELFAFLASDVYPYAKVGFPFRTGDGCEGVIADLYLEVGQEPVNDIHPIERVALLFSSADESYPEVLSLRADFPQVPHLNLREHEYPRSLCIYEEPYPVVKLTWTPARFLERIRIWFRDTARGVLHREDQTLEPILMPGPRHLVIPADLFSRGSNDTPEKLWIIPRYLSPASELLVAKRTDRTTRLEQQQALAYLATTFQCPSQTHGVIHRLPKSLLDVHDLMVATGMDLLSALRERMLTWSREDAPLGARLILIAFFPKARTAGKPPEVSDIWTFLTNQNIRQLGATLGFWQALATGQVAAFVGADIDRQRASTVDVLVLNPSFALNRPLAALVNGYEPSTMQITAVGVGALGSQTIAKLVRGGFGFWTLVDNDHLLPHNVARHELPECFVGFPKAIAMQMLGNNLIEDQVVSDAIVADILYPEGDKREHLEAAFRRADLILDFSASIPVARHLAASDLGPRRISAFLNFDASDLVLLAEDTERHFPLDCLEMQYYREIITRPELSDHLSKTNDKWVRYGQTCRDLTLIVSEDRVGLHSAIASNAIRRVVQNTNATICVWRTASDLSVRAFTSPPAIIREVAQGDWRIRTDDVLLRRVSELRTERLPNETGGILIGAFDLERKIAYVVDTIPSPPDSKEWPVLYIRGCQGLPERLQQIDKMTVGMLQYVGEWHSHPDCCSTSPSAEDRKVFEWLSEHMRIDGLPPMMAIVGEGGNVNWLLGSLS